MTGCSDPQTCRNAVRAVVGGRLGVMEVVRGKRVR